jgi:hypothetical protein
MPEFGNAMEVFKLLEKTNCRKCNETTCLAFASKVFLGQKSLGLCPFVASEIVEAYEKSGPSPSPGSSEQDRMISELKRLLSDCDLEQAAPRTGGTYSDGWLTLRIFGKPFRLNTRGEFRTDLHINPWMVVPILVYVLHCEGRPLTGEWIPFRELENARSKNNLFVQRGELPLKKIADTYPGLFGDLVEMFSGTPLDRKYESDVSLVLYPLPHLPMLVCYWRPEDGMESDLNLFFDASANANGGSELIFGLTTGMVTMFEKFILTHGVKED